MSEFEYKGYCPKCEKQGIFLGGTKICICYECEFEMKTKNLKLARVI